MPPVWSEHALARAQERFSGVDLEQKYLGAKRLKKRQRSKIRALCPWSAEIFMSGDFKGRYCMITRCNIVFVVQVPETIVTVFRLGEK